MLLSTVRRAMASVSYKMPAVLRMSNGVDIPFVGLGTGGKFSTPEETRESVRMALDIGYRHIDTATMYNTEKIIGEVLQDYINEGKLTRDDVFITTKLHPNDNHPSMVEPALRQSLANLKTSYVDLYLVHSPCPYKEIISESGEKTSVIDDTELTATWAAMEKVYSLGLCKAIGVSNFTIEQLQAVYASATVKPMNHQIEVNVHWPQRELLATCTAMNITVTAYGPLGCPGKRGAPNWPSFLPVDEPVVIRLAEKHGKTPAQILLRHLTQRGVIVVPKSTKRHRLEENFQSSDFFLADEDIAALNDIPSRRRFYLWDKAMEHPNYPFKDVLKLKEEGQL